MFFAMDPGFARLQGDYVGTMFFYDSFEKKEKSMPIDVRFHGAQEGGAYDTKYRFAPPKYQWAVDSVDVSADGTQWIERNLNEKLTFKLTNWKAFCAGTSDWFEIERPQFSSNFSGQFRRRWTIKPNSVLWSEKWLKPSKGTEWEFSHRQELQRRQN